MRQESEALHQKQLEDMRNESEEVIIERTETEEVSPKREE